MEVTERRCNAVCAQQALAEHFGYDRRMISSLNHARVNRSSARKNECFSVAMLLARPSANESCKNHHTFQGNDFILHALSESRNLYFHGTGDIEFLHPWEQTWDEFRHNFVHWTVWTTADQGIHSHRGPGQTRS